MVKPAVPDAVEPAVAAVAQRLCPHPLRQVSAAGGGGNSRLFKVQCDQGSFALKSYPPQDDRRHDRLGHEFGALRFLARHAPVLRVPVAIARDRAAGFGLYSWIDGDPIDAPDNSALDEALVFVGHLYRLTALPEARELAPACEASLSLGALLEQINQRHRRLNAAANHHDLHQFLAGRFTPALADARRWAFDHYRDHGLDPVSPLTLAQCMLSPSDFGFHNALRQGDGRLSFVDFEYFGWDDPVRLVADFLWHPAMTLPEHLSAGFAAGSSAIFDADRHFSARFAAQWPLVGLRWCMIVLNEFLPDRWLGRVRAGQTGERDEILSRQLAKAGHILERVDSSMGMKSTRAAFGDHG